MANLSQGELRTCIACKVRQDNSEFLPNQAGRYRRICRQCCGEYETKKCVGCDSYKPTEDFYSHAREGGSGRQKLCKPCFLARRKRTHHRKTRDPAPSTLNPKRPAGWFPPPSEVELGKWHQRLVADRYIQTATGRMPWGIEKVPYISQEEDDDWTALHDSRHG